MAERREAFLAALADDFNTPRAWAELFELIAEGNRRPLAGAREVLAEMLELLGPRDAARGRPRRSPTPRRRAAGRARAGPERARLRARRRASATSSPSSAGRSATRPTGATARALGVSGDAEVVYGRRPVAEAERGRRAGAARLARAETDAGRAHAGSPARPTTRASSPRSIRTPTRTPSALLAPAGRADRRPRPGPGPAQPRRGRALGRGGRRRPAS